MDISDNNIPLDETNEETETTEETENINTEDTENIEESFLDDSENDTETEEIPLDDLPVDETGDLSETVSGSDVRTDEPINLSYDGEYPSISGNDVYIIETTTEEPPFLTKPFNDYTTSEALLFLIFILFVLTCLWSLLSGK